MKAPDTGIRDGKGHWKPSEPCGYAPPFRCPWNLKQMVRWLFGWGGYLWPRHLSYLVLALLSWHFFQVDLNRTGNLNAGWILLVFLRNEILLLSVFGFYHLTLYIWKIQGEKGKYHPKGQAQNTKKFLFADQVKDNMFWTLGSGAIIWTGWEVLYFWLAGKGVMPLIEWADNPIWFVALFILIPLWRETHFYFVHRLLHWKPLLRAIHSNHHKNPNPAPWSGMSMHPVEHLLYFSVLLIHFVVPSHPIHMLFNSQLTALTPAQGHTGYHGPLFRGIWPVGDYFHYLHHKHVSCNFGGGTIPWDKWLGRFYDGEGPYSTKRKSSASES